MELNLSTREIAILAWSVPVVIWAARQPGVREPIRNALRIAAERRMLTFFLFLSLWTWLEVMALRSIGAWAPSQLKETIVWFALVGTVGGVRAQASFENPDYRRLAIQSLSGAVVVEFLVGLVPFRLPVELVLVPLVGALSLLVGVASPREGHAQVKKTLEGLLAVIGLGVGVGAAIQAWRTYGSLSGPDVLRSFIVPPALSVLFLPVIYLLVLQARLTWLFGKLRGTWAYRTYARVRLTLRLGLRPQRILDFGRRHAFELPAIKTIRELEELLAKDARKGAGRAAA